MLTPEHLSELFQVEEGRFRQTGGSMELPRPEGAPEVFVLAGGGSGRAVFWQLQSWNHVCGRDRIGSRLRLSGGLYIGVQIDCSPRI